MATLDTAAVAVGVSGEIRTAPLGTTAPTDSTASYAGGWVPLGYISDDGLTESYDDSVEEIGAWQSISPVRRVITGSTVTWQFTVIQQSKTALETFHPGSSVSTVTSTSTIEVKQPVSNVRAYAFDVIDGAKHYRILVPRGEVTERGDITYVTEEAVGYEMTVTGYPDSAGVVAIKISDDPAWATA